MLLTPNERSEWVDHAFPPGTKKRFKVLQKPEMKDRVNSAMIEVK